MSKKIKVLSLFDGISVAQQALKELGYDVEYYASEIDKYAIQLTQKNHPNTNQLGSVVGLGFDAGQFVRQKSEGRADTMGVNFMPEEIDLLIGGSPCQDLSIAGKREGLSSARSGLFWEYVRILKEVKPKYFVLENVNSMPKEAKDIITKALGVEPIMIDAGLVSAQQRKRLFWTNIPNINQPNDRGILLKDILEENVDGKYFMSLKQIEGILKSNYEDRKPYMTDGKCGTIKIGGDVKRIIVKEATRQGYAIATEGQSIDVSFPNSKTRRGRVGNKVKNIMTARSIGVFVDGGIRYLTPIEYERLQSLPDNYTEGVSNTQRYKALGNAFNKEVVKHILKNMA